MLVECAAGRGPQHVAQLLALHAMEEPNSRGLLALAQAAPQACLAYLACDPEEVRASFDDESVSAALEIALEALGESSEELVAVLEAVARRYSGFFSPRSAARLASLVSADPPAAVAEAVAASLRAWPCHPGLLRGALRIARARGDHASTNKLLTRLGRADNTPATASFVYRTRAEIPTSHCADVRIAMLSSYTIDQLVHVFDLECRAIGLAPAFYVSPFNSWTLDVLNDRSELRRFGPDIAFLSVAIDDLVPLASPLSADDLEALGEIALDRVVAVARAYGEWAEGRPLVVNSFFTPFAAGPLGILDGRRGPSRGEWLAATNARLASALRGLPNCHLFDVGQAMVEAGTSPAADPKLRHLAALRIPPPALGSVGRALVRYVAALKGVTKKCVVVDLDNTLWGGLAGEDGVGGIRLGATAPGSEFVEFQEFLRALKERGVLLAIASKNNPSDALSILREHPAMVLREEDFSAIQIGWNPKHESLLAIARDLNIGIDAMVFVDDNPDERELMRQMLPEVLTLDLPRDPALYRSALEALPQLEILSLTAEDTLRAGSYKGAALREQARLDGGTLDDFLHSLNIAVSIGTAHEADFARVTQLFARTNQFNTTTRRYTQNDVAHFATDPTRRLYVLRAKDRFSDHGLVALALVAIRGKAWELESVVMSCRVIGYGIETALLACVCAEALAGGAQTLVGAFAASAKNAPAEGTFASHGFARGPSTDGIDTWILDLSHPVAFPSWIAPTSETSRAT